MAQLLTDRQREIKARLDQGMTVREIAEDLGIHRNGVYQQIQRLRNHGVLPTTYTPTGLPPRESRPGMDVLQRLVTDDDSESTGLAGARALARELVRVRDDLDAITQRISEIIPR